MKRLKTNLGNIQVTSTVNLTYLLNRLEEIEAIDSTYGVLRGMERLRRELADCLIGGFTWDSTGAENSAVFTQTYRNLRLPHNEYIHSTGWIQIFYDLFTEPDNPKLNLASGDTDEDE